MHSRLGDIIFRGVNSVLSFSRSKKSKVARMPKVYGKDSLQKTGDEPDSISIEVRLHNAWINVQDTLDLISDYKSSGTILEYIDGNGLKLGDFVLEDYSEIHEANFADGRIVSAVVTINLVESVDERNVDQQAIEDRENAFAANPNNTIPIVDVLTGTTAFAAVSRQANSADISSRKAIDDLEKAINAPSQKESIFARARNQFVDSAEYLENAISITQDAATIAASAPNLLARLQDMAANVDTMIQRIDQGDLSNAIAQSQLLTGSLNGLPQVILPLQLDLILRNG